MKIGLTGGIATGKSTVSSLLAAQGAKLIDADVIAREVMLPGHPVLAAVAAHFGQAVLLEDGSLNRKKLGEIIFNDPKQRQALNDISHPAIRQEIKSRMQAYEEANSRDLIVVDIPLLYESGLESMFEEVWLVYVPREIQIKRLMDRDGLNIEQAEARLAAQMDIEQKRAKAAVIIDNSGTIENTEHQLNKLWQRIGLES